jgi:hypothetical protein
MAKYTSHIRIPVSLFKNEIFLGLAGRNKADCLAILVVLLRYSNQKTGECYPRLALMHSLLGISKATIYRRIKLMVSLGLLKKKRLSSTNLYKLNPVLMVGSSQGDMSDTSVGLIGAVRLTGINKDNFNIYLNRNNSNNKMDNKINKIDRIVNSKEIDKQTKIIELASVPLPELRKCFKQHPYYIQQAIEYQEQELRDKRSLPKHIVEQAMTAAVSKTIKNRSAAYKAKVEYNKRNGLNWKGEPIKK